MADIQEEKTVFTDFDVKNSYFSTDCYIQYTTINKAKPMQVYLGLFIYLYLYYSFL